MCIGGEAMAYTVAQAARTIGKSKATVLRAIAAGKVSAARDAATGAFFLDPAEVHRLWPWATGEAAVPMHEAMYAAPAEATRSDVLQAELAASQARFTDAQDQIADLRRRLDTATAQLGEALTQVRLLTDQRQPGRRSWWRWR
jgi:hypothetical protein